MSLTDKIVNLESVNCCDVKSIREAVRELKAICDKNDGYCSIDDINEKFGEKLI